MINLKKTIAGLSLVTASILYGVSSDGTYTNVYGTLTNGGNIMSDSTYSNYGVLSQVPNRAVTTDGTYTNYAKLEILNSGTIEEITSNDNTDNTGGDTGGSTSSGGGTTPPPVTEPTPETPVIVEPTPETPVVVEPTPETPADNIIDNDGNFDEDPTDQNIDVIVISDDGTENKETINTKDTGESVGSVTEVEQDADTATKEFQIQLLNIQTGESKSQTITVKNENATSTTTETGFEIKSTTSNEINDVTTKVELNTNGTSVTSVVAKDKVTGESKASAIASFKTDAITEVEEDGSVLVTNKEVESQEDGTTTEVEAKAKVNSDGSAEHSIIRKDSQGQEITTKATSKANNTVTSLLEDGTVQTKATLTKEDGSKATVSVDGNKDGKATHRVKITDTAGTEIVTKATSEIPGATTAISEDGSVETRVKTAANVELKVQASPDGSATHSVAIPKEDGSTVTSKATSKIPGASTTVTTEGKVVTEAKVIKTDDNGEKFEIRAVAETNEDGTTKTRFERVNLTTGEAQELDNTVNENTPFEEGNEVEVEEIGTDLQIKVRSKVSKEIVIE